MINLIITLSSEERVIMSQLVLSHTPVTLLLRRKDLPESTLKKFYVSMRKKSSIQTVKVLSEVTKSNLAAVIFLKYSPRSQKSKSLALTVAFSTLEITIQKDMEALTPLRIATSQRIPHTSILHSIKHSVPSARLSSCGGLFCQTSVESVSTLTSSSSPCFSRT